MKVLLTVAPPKDRKFHGAKDPWSEKSEKLLLGNESSMKRKFYLWTFRSWEWKCSTMKSQSFVYILCCL